MNQGNLVVIPLNFTLEQAKNSNLTHILACGDTELLQSDTVDSLASIGEEGIVIHSESQNGVQIVVANGNDPSFVSRLSTGVGRGAAMACYTALKDMGVPFIQPFAPRSEVPAFPRVVQDRVEAPRWDIRGWHIHTQHPLELCDLLTGFDIKDAKTGKVVTTWESMLSDWGKLLDWLAAAHINRVEWLPLEAKSWDTYATSPERAARMKNLTDMARGVGILPGVDAAIALRQQHAFDLVTKEAAGDPVKVQESIRTRMAWLNQSGFEFLSTERYLFWWHLNHIVVLILYL